jgi:hypothetical protein
VLPDLGGLAASEAESEKTDNVKQNVITFSRIVINANFPVRFWEGLADNKPLA